MKTMKENLKEVVSKQKGIFSKLGMYYYYMAKEDKNLSADIKELIHEANMLEYEKRIIQEKMEEMSSKIFCPACHAELESDSVFCNKCGVKLAEYREKKTEDIEDDASTVILNPQKTEPIMQERYIGKTCVFCGTELDEDQRFCTNCGRKVEK